MGSEAKKMSFDKEFQDNEKLKAKKEETLGKVYPFKRKGHGESKVTEKPAAAFFYKVSNHIELFKIGKSFLKDYHEGYKSFAISSTGYHTSQQQTILGLASFFDHNKEDLNILIMSDNIFDGTYKEVISASELNKVNFKDSKLTCEVHSFYQHFDFLDLHSLAASREQNEFGDYDVILDLLFKNYDIILWDVPELHLLEEAPDVYFPVITRFDCLSIVVSNNVSKSKDVEKICAFFSSYGLSLKGLLIDSVAIKELETGRQFKNKKPWWRRIFS